MGNNYYQVLEVARDVDQKALVARFRELVRERHPDRFQGEEKRRAEADFQNITEAFNVLRDPQRRAQHDQELDKPASRGHDPAQVALVYMKRGVKAYKGGNFLQAADNFDRATQAEPLNHLAWHHLALACTQETRWLPKAQEAIVRACELRANHLPSLKLAGKIFAQSGMQARAKEYYNQALSLAESDLSIRKALQELGGGPRKAAAATDSAKKEKSGLFGKFR